MANKKKDCENGGSKEDNRLKWQTLNADGKLTWVSLCLVKLGAIEQLVVAAVNSGVVRTSGSVVLVPAGLCCKSDPCLRRLIKRVSTAAVNRRVVWLPNTIHGCRVGLSDAVSRLIVIGDSGDLARSDADPIRALAGDDYWAVWHGDKQIFCYHGNTGEILAQVCKSLGKSLEYVGDDMRLTDDDWELLQKMPFSEFEQLCRDRKRAEVQKQIMQKERELLDLRLLLGPEPEPT